MVAAGGVYGDTCHLQARNKDLSLAAAAENRDRFRNVFLCERGSQTIKRKVSEHGYIFAPAWGDGLE